MYRSERAVPSIGIVKWVAHMAAALALIAVLLFGVFGCAFWRIGARLDQDGGPPPAWLPAEATDLHLRGTGLNLYFSGHVPQSAIEAWATKRGLPLICLSDNDGGRLPDLLGWRFSSVPFDFSSFLQSPDGFPAVPRVTAVLGPAYGDAALHAAMGDLVVMQKDTAIALSGPPTN